MILPSDYHKPVFLNEVIEGLRVKSNRKYIDATLGGGGHTFEILNKSGIVLGIDADAEAIDYVKNQIQRVKGIFLGRNLFLESGNFNDIKRLAHKNGFWKVAGVIFDLGISSYQLDYSGRGFSFEQDELLDMRIDKNRKIKAVDIVNNYKEKELYDIFTKYSEELCSGDIAKVIVRARAINPIETTANLSKIILGALHLLEYDRYNRKSGRNVLARIYQALRIEVNDEIENIKKAIWESLDLLDTGGRLAIITFHSVEDREVKNTFKKAFLKQIVKIITKSPILPKYSEIKVNRRSKSAKLRIVEKL